LPPNRAGHYILYSCSFFFFFFFFFFYSSPIFLFSAVGELDVYHTSTHGVAFVRIQNAGNGKSVGLKCAARGSTKVGLQDAKTRKIIGICAPSHNFVGLGPIPSQLRHISTIGKKIVKQQYVLHTFS